MVKKAKQAKKVKKGIKNRKRLYFSIGIFLLAFVSSLFFWRIIEANIFYKETKTVINQDASFQIDVPREMNKVQSSINILEYSHVKAGKTASVLSHVRAESQFIGSQQMQATKSEITSQLKEARGHYYEFFKQKSYDSSSAKDLSFSKFNDYNSNNLSDALSADFNYKDAATQVKGSVIIAFSEDTLYLIVAESTAEIWDNNYEVWQNVLASFKLN